MPEPVPEVSYFRSPRSSARYERMTSSRLFSLMRSSPKSVSAPSLRSTGAGCWRAAMTSGGSSLSAAAAAGGVDLPGLVGGGLLRVRGVDVVVDAVDEVPQHLLVLLLHQLADDLREVLGADDVRVGRLLRGEDVPADEEVRDDVGVLQARVLGLDVVHLPLVLDVVVEPHNHLLRFEPHRPATVPCRPLPG